MYYVYVLLSLSDKKFYIGYTENVQNRLQKHNEGGVPSTAKRRPLKLVFYETYINKGDALRRESYFKTDAGKKTLRLMIRETLRIII